MNKKDNKNIKHDNSYNFKKSRVRLSFQIIAFLIATFAILIGSFFAIYNGNINTYDINYRGGYGADVIVEKNEDPTNPITFTEKQASNALINKLDPLSNKNYQFRGIKMQDSTLGSKNAVSVTTAVNTFVDAKTFYNEISRPGYVYFTDAATGKDLLYDGSTRTSVTDIISDATAGVDKTNGQHNPTLTFNLKNEDDWESKIITPTKKDGLNIWTDIPYFINDLRNINNKKQLTELSTKLDAKVTDPNARKVFDFSSTHSYKGGNNLLNFYTWDHSEQLAFLKENKLSNNFWAVKLGTDTTTSGTLNSNMNPSDKTQKGNIYIDSLRNKLLELFSDKSINVNHEFDKYLLSTEAPSPSSSTLSAAPNSNKDNVITMNSTLEAKEAASLISGGLQQIKFIILNTFNVPAEISSALFITSFFILLIIIIIAFVFLIVYYRLFGFICCLGLILVLSLMYFILGLLLIEIGPSLILAIVLVFSLALESNINFFEHYRKEYHKQSASNSLAFKLANKKTILSVLDYHIVILISSLLIFLVATDSLKMFSTILLVVSLLSLVISFFVIRLMYYVVIKFKWFDNEKYRILGMPKENYLINIFKFKKNKQKTNYDKIDETPISSQYNNNLEKQSYDNSEEQVKDEPKIKSNSFILFFRNMSINKSILLFFIFVSIISSICFLSIGPKLGVASKLNWTDFYVNIINKQDLKYEKNIKNWISTTGDKDHKFDYKIQDIYPTPNYYWDDQYNLVIRTSIKRGTKMYYTFLSGFTEKSESRFGFNNLSGDGFWTSEALTVSFQKMFIQVLIILGSLVLIIFLYMLIKFNWAQHIAVLGSVVFIAMLVILIINISQVWITLNMLLAFSGVIIYAIADGIVISSKIKYTKDKFSYKLFSPILKKYLEYKKTKKEFKKIRSKNYIEKVNELVLSDQEYTNSEFKKEKKAIYAEYIKVKKDYNKKILKVSYKNYVKEFKNRESNYLLKVKSTVAKESIMRTIIMSILFSTIFIVFILLKGIPLGFGLLILIGLILSIISSSLILVSIWCFLDKYRVLNKLKILHYLENKNLDLDEEDIEGINC